MYSIFLLKRFCNTIVTKSIKYVSGSMLVFKASKQVDNVNTARIENQVVMYTSGRIQ